MKRPRAEASGILPVDKPIGPTSHDVVARARRALGERRIGHTGTLDPFASGLMLLCIGTATRLAEYLTGLPKVYRATARLGIETDTADRTGEPVRESEGWRELDEERVRASLEAQLGEIEQMPPAYSAKKIEGERAYELARRGEAPRLRAVRVVIHRIELLELRLPEVDFEVECSAGTYIRSIARDLGDALGVGAHLTRLRRTRVGRHDVADAVTLDELVDAERVRRAWIEPLDALAHLPRVDVDAPAAERLVNGRPIEAGSESVATDGPVAVAFENRLLAVGEWHGQGLQPRKVFPVG